MTRGKRTCRILKDIRRQIAEANGIEFVTSECRYKGDCLGTCPKCEAEVRYLEEQLRSRSLAGKAIALAGLSAGMLLFTGCDIGLSQKTADNPEKSVAIDRNDSSEDSCIVTTGVDIVIEYDYEKDSIRAVSPTDTDSNLPAPDYSEDRVFYISEVENKPLFPGGEAEMYKWISSNIVYPLDAAEEGITGRVIVEFVIERDGSISDVIILRGRHPSLDNEAIRLVKAMPVWIPGYFNGNTVRVKYTLPIKFKIENK